MEMLGHMDTIDDQVKFGADSKTQTSLCRVFFVEHGKNVSKIGMQATVYFSPKHRPSLLRNSGPSQSAVEKVKAFTSVKAFSHATRGMCS